MLTCQMKEVPHNLPPLQDTAIYDLVDAVVDVIRQYDKSRDHLKHSPGADCIRCRLVEALPPYARSRV